MTIDYIFTILAVAGIAVLWRNLLHDIRPLSDFVSSFPWFPRKALKCGFCFTYWLSLVLVLVFDPLHGWLPPLRFLLPSAILYLLQIVFSWMAVGIGASIIRFGYVALQELVHYQMHGVRGDHDHHH